MKDIAIQERIRSGESRRVNLPVRQAGTKDQSSTRVEESPSALGVLQ